MASYNELNALIDAYINRNGIQAITGQILNGVLKAMVEQLGRGYTIMGAATPTTDPGTPDGPECYFAYTPGTYTDFDGLQVVPGELALLCYTPSDGWMKETVYEGFQEVGATIDGNVGTPSVGVSYANGVLSFDFHNMKGNPGEDGNDGAPAGFGTIAATVDENIGTPGVTVQSSGPDTAKNITFAFTNLKGETGVTSVVATVDNTTGTPACTVSLVGQQLTLAFTGLKGAQGDTGSSVDYPFTIVNNLTTDDATQALSAAQGVVLDGKVTQLEAKVTDLNRAFEMDQVVGSNLLDMSACTSGFYWTNGHNDSTSYQYTDYIPVEEGETYSLQSKDSGTRALENMRFIVFFDSTKTMLASGNISANTTSVTIPSTAAYMIVSFGSTIVLADEPAIVKGTQIVPYVAYFAPYNQPFIKTSAIDDDTIISRTIADKAVSAGKIDNNAVNIGNIAFAHPQNMVDKTDPDVMLGYTQYSAAPVANANFNLTGYIPVSEGETYVFSGGEGTDFQKRYARFIAYFNASKVFLSYEGNKDTFTTPANTAFVRLSIAVGGVWNRAQMEQGKYATQYYIPYSKKIDTSALPYGCAEFPKIILPRKSYILKDYENSIYFKNITDFLDTRYLPEVLLWGYRSRCARTSTYTGVFYIRLLSNDGKFTTVAESHSTSVRGQVSTDNGALVVNCIGDSFTYNGDWFEQMNALCPSLSFVGMRKSYNTVDTLRAEGRGGWTLDYYMTKAAFSNNVYEGFSPFLHPSGYKYYGPIEFWKKIVNGTIGADSYTMNGFDDFKSWFGTDGKKLSPSTNDLMYDAENTKYIYWNGSAWADFSGTPTFVFDYATYISTWGITSPDVVVIMLGVNDFFAGYTEEQGAEWNTQMAAVIASIQAYATAASKTIKIAICTNNTVASLPNSSYDKMPERNSIALWKGRRNCINTFDTDAYETAKVYVVDTGAVFDPDYGFATQEVKPFDYYEGDARELYDTNGVHPSAAGYKQLGQCVAAWLQAVR